MSAYRTAGFGPALTDGVKYLLIWNVIFYLLQHFILAKGVPGVGLSMERFLGLVPVLVLKKLFIWQVVTYLFLHGGFFHILFNMFALWMFGSDLERIWGTRRFLTYYFFTGVGAGILTLLFTPGSIVPTIGASGAVYGLLLGFAYYFPERRIYLYMLFPVSARVFVIIFGAIAFLSSISQQGSGIAHIAHLGGLVFGWIYIKWAGKYLDRFEARRRRNRLRVVDFRGDDR